MSKKVQPAPTPAVAYLRKSTDGKGKDGRIRQENSLPRQKKAIMRIAQEENCVIVRWYEDPGISGWKSGRKRPGYQQLLDDAKKRKDFQAIIVDDANRLTRGEWRKCVIDIEGLYEAGITRIISCKDGAFRIDDINNQGEAHRLVAILMANHEFCRGLSRAVTYGLHEAAEQHKRSGGCAPYAYAGVADDKGKIRTLKLGVPKHVKVVRRVFNEFVKLKRSYGDIAGRLNADGIPSPRGREWKAATIRSILMHPAYKGTYTFGRTQTGVFYSTSDDGQVVDTKKEKVDLKPWKFREPVFQKDGVHPAIVTPEQWEAAQQRIAGFAQFASKGGRRPRKDSCALAGVLVCDRCGKNLYGVIHRGRRVYRCGANLRVRGACKSYEIKEANILPFVMRLFAQEVKGMTGLLNAPPEQLTATPRRDAGERAVLEQERDELLAKVEIAKENYYSTSDERIRAGFTDMLQKWYDRLDAINATLNKPSENDGKGYNVVELEALRDWWEDFEKRAVTVAVPLDKMTDEERLLASFHRDAFAEFNQPNFDPNCEYVRVSSDIVNEALHDLGAKVRLRWRTKYEKTANGTKRPRHELVGGEFSLGQQSGLISVDNSAILGAVPHCEQDYVSAVAIRSPQAQSKVILCSGPLPIKGRGPESTCHAARRPHALAQSCERRG